MLTSLDWLNADKPYPPPSEKERIEQYKANEQLFLTKHPAVWKEAFEAIAKRLRKKSFDVETILNYQQLLSKKTADFICSQPPTFETEQDTDELTRLLSKQAFYIRLYEAFIDVSRYGNALIKFVGNRISAASPLYWFPIVEPGDLKYITQHVIAYPTTPDDKGNMTELYVEIHGIGTVETRKYVYDSDKKEIGKLKEDAKTATTGLNDFAIQVLTNVTHSSSVFGLDDYVIINSIVKSIMWRLHCSDTVIDKHSEPSVSGPSSALDFDERTGMYYLNLGNYFKRNNKEDPDVNYITWDGNLEAAYKEIELLITQLHTLTEMGQAFAEAAGGTADSGEALKLRMVSPRVKAARLSMLNAETVKRIISMFAKLNSVTLDFDSLTVHWNDGLPVDEKEQTETLTTATGGKAIMSQYTAMKRMGLSDAKADEEMARLDEERAASSPIPLSVVETPSKEEPPNVTA